MEKGFHPMDTHSPSSTHVMGRLAVIWERVRAAVAVRQSTDPAPDDPFRGFYLSDSQVSGLLDAEPPMHPSPWGDGAHRQLRDLVERQADEAAKAGHEIRLRSVAGEFGLDDADIDIMLVALAPDVECRFERLLGYLQDDLTRRRATIGLALELVQLSPTSPSARVRFQPDAPLVDGSLLLVEEGERPFLTRPLRVPDQVAAWLLGSDSFDPLLGPLLVEPTVATAPDADSLARALASGVDLCYLREGRGGSGCSLAVAALEILGIPSLSLDLRRLRDVDPGRAITLCEREARLRRAAVIAGPIEVLCEANSVHLGTLAELRCPVLLTGHGRWDPAWSQRVPHILKVREPTSTEREQLWRTALDGNLEGGIDSVAVTEPLRLAPEEVLRAATAVRLRAIQLGSPVGRDELLEACAEQAASGLERLARRIEPRAGWQDLIAPEETLTGLRTIVTRTRLRRKVLQDWGMGGKGSRARGVTALFAGQSGTGKTLSAEIIAGELGLPVYAINLATVVDKYIGETEKNLDRLFEQAEGVPAVLLFDEADALFGKRSEVRDSHDRYANIEIAYLLQRMEYFEGVAVLATNLRANLDDAFLRRLDVIVDFPLPDEAARLALWQVHLPPPAPLSEDVNLTLLAASFAFAGGSIRNVAVAAGFTAAASDRAIGMADLTQACVAEYRKMGRLSPPTSDAAPTIVAGAPSVARGNGAGARSEEER